MSYNWWEYLNPRIVYNLEKSFWSSSLKWLENLLLILCIHQCWTGNSKNLKIWAKHYLHSRNELWDVLGKTIFKLPEMLNQLCQQNKTGHKRDFRFSNKKMASVSYEKRQNCFMNWNIFKEYGSIKFDEPKRFT